MTICPRCGVENKPGKAACWNCWAPLEAMAQEARPKKKGKRRAAPPPTEAEAEVRAAEAEVEAPLVEAEAEMPPAEAEVEAPPKARKFALPRPKIPALGKRLKLILIGILAAAVLGGGAFWFLGQSAKPDEVAARYCQALNAGETEKVQALASQDTKDMTLPAALKLMDYSVSAGPTISGSTAEVPVEAAFSLDTSGVPAKYRKEADALAEVLGKPIIVQIVLVKEGMGWKVDQQQTSANVSRAVFGPKGGGLAEEIFGKPGELKPQGVPGEPAPPGTAPPAPQPTRPAEPPH